jgi:hypothetical protein
MYHTVHRCTDCKKKCPKNVERITTSPTRCVLTEANKFTRKIARNSLDEKLRVWGNAAPPMHLSRPRYVIDLVALEQAKVVMNGSLMLEEDREPVGLKLPGENQSNGTSDDDNDVQTISDDST